MGPGHGRPDSLRVRDVHVVVSQADDLGAGGLEGADDVAAELSRSAQDEDAGGMDG
jgi:hypothetical protein